MIDGYEVQRILQLILARITYKGSSSNRTIMPKHKIIYWIPRILSILFILFLAIFSLDVFDEGLGFWQTILGLFMHNIPALILLLFTIIAWKRPLVGAVAYIFAGALYLVLMTMVGVPRFQALSMSIIIAGPALLVGILFLVEWRTIPRTSTPHGNRIS